MQHRNSSTPTSPAADMATGAVQGRENATATQIVSIGKPKRRKYARRAERREHIKRDIIALFQFKLALSYVEDGYSWGMVARLMGVSTSWLCHLNNLYKEGGNDRVVPYLADVFPRALDMNIFDGPDGEAQ